MATATLQLTGSVGGLPTGSKNITVPLLQLGNAVGTILDLVLQSGDNIINIPSGATMAVISLPASNNQAVMLKGLNADTGFAIRTNIWTALSLSPLVNFFILNAAGQISGVEITFV